MEIGGNFEDFKLFVSGQFYEAKENSLVAKDIVGWRVWNEYHNYTYIPAYQKAWEAVNGGYTQQRSTEMAASAEIAGFQTGTGATLARGGWGGWRAVVLSIYMVCSREIDRI